MAIFEYIAQTNQGEVQRGQVEAASWEAARDHLIQRRYRVLGLKEVRGGFQLEFPWRLTRSVNSSDRELMFRQLAVLLESGLELSTALREISENGTRKAVRQLCATLTDKVCDGYPLSKSLAESNVFRPLAVQLVQVGEETGELSTMLRRAADFSAARRQAQENLVAAMAYPLFVAIAAIGVAVYLVGWAIPKLGTFLDALGRKMPPMTQTLLDIATWCRIYGGILAIALFAAAVAAAMFYAWPPGRAKTDRILLSVPILGDFIRTAETQQLASALAIMLHSGVFLPRALHVSASLIRNHYLAQRIQHTETQVANGESLTIGFRGAGFADMLGSMIAVGERSGTLPEVLDHVAEFYSERVQDQLRRFVRWLEPIIIIVVGGLVGYVYMAFFVAMMSAGGKF